MLRKSHLSEQLSEQFISRSWHWKGGFRVDCCENHEREICKLPSGKGLKHSVVWCSTKLGILSEIYRPCNFNLFMYIISSIKMEDCMAEKGFSHLTWRQIKLPFDPMHTQKNMFYFLNKFTVKSLLLSTVFHGNQSNQWLTSLKIILCPLCAHQSILIRLGSLGSESLNGRPLTGDATGATYPGPAMK